MTTIKSIIGDHPLLRTMHPPHLDLLAECGHEASYLPGQFLFRQHEPADRFFLILEGQVAVEAHDPAGTDTPIQTLSDGELLGWSWLFQPFVWHFQARAVASTRVIAFDGAHLLIACEANHDLGYELIKRFAQVLIQRLHATRLNYLKCLPRLPQPLPGPVQSLRL